MPQQETGVCVIICVCVCVCWGDSVGVAWVGGWVGVLGGNQQAVRMVNQHYPR